MSESLSRPGDSCADYPEPIAIVSAGCVFPGARTLQEFWRLIESGTDVNRPVPDGRWILDPKTIHSQGAVLPDRVYTERGCFIEDFILDASGLDLPKHFLATLDPSVHLLLAAGRDAWVGARMDQVDRARVGVVLGNIALPTQTSSVICQQVLTGLLEQHQASRRAAPPALGEMAINRYVSGLPAGVLARALGLGGGTSTLDAACASSLYALKLACDELTAGRADAMLAGGLSRPDSLYTQMGFCQLRALSQRGRCAPFDVASDGLIVGEGAAVLVLKRLADALRDGDPIQAVIRGIGLSNDIEGNLLSPSSEGQLRALRQAYQQAGWRPDQVDLIECHATGTPVGDAVEFASLTRLWQNQQWQPGQCVLGAVKANIGHLLTAAGSASLIKILLALKHQTLPPTANFQRPADKIPLAGSAFRILTESQPWPQRDAATPRRAAVNGFGFGGINAHLLLEEWTEIGARSVPGRSGREVAFEGATTGDRSRSAGTFQPGSQTVEVDEIPKSKKPTEAIPVAIVGMAIHVGNWPNLRAFQERVLGGEDAPPSERTNWRGIIQDDAKDAPRLGPPGYYLEDLTIPVNRYRIPPKELAELLPQQALMLEVVRSALVDAGASGADPIRTGVFIGLGLDLRTTDFFFRWTNLARIKDAEAYGVPLTADRTMGALAGVNASRIAKEFRFGGPSHTVCSEECSGTRALEIAMRSLQNHELDRAVAGAVDIAGDLRALWATDAIQPYSRQGVCRPFDVDADGPVPGEGAVALVLKRLEDARRQGDRVYAVIRGMGSSSGGAIGPRIGLRQGYHDALARAYAEAQADPNSVTYLETDSSACRSDDRAEAQILASFFKAKPRLGPCYLGSAKADVGHTGAASGLVSVVKASLALYHEILPGLRGLRQPIPELARENRPDAEPPNHGRSGLIAPALSQYWVRDRAGGPRRAGVTCSSVDGNVMHVVLEGLEERGKAPVCAGGYPSTETLPETLFVLRGKEQADLLELIKVLRASPVPSGIGGLKRLARDAWRQSAPAGQHVLAFIARDATQLKRLLDSAAEAGRSDGLAMQVTSADRDRVFFSPPGKRVGGGIGFVFPGTGNHFAEMGRGLALWFPHVLRAQDGENHFLASQMCVNDFWNVPARGASVSDPRTVICGQVALGTFASDLVVSFGVKPDALIGYSLGETTGLFALRAWRDRDEMLRRLMGSDLFARDLAGEPERLRAFWRLPEGTAVRWQAGVVDRSAREVREGLSAFPRVYLLIINTPGECVIGGDSAQVEGLVSKLHCHFFPLNGVSTVHCELVQPVERAYRELHLFETSAPPGVRFFSGGWGREYVPDRDQAADAIVAQARETVDFPRLVRAAYDSGIRRFIELGPGGSCSRMIGQILEGKPHWSRPLSTSDVEPVLGVLRVLAQLIAEGGNVDLSRLGGDSPAEAPELESAAAEPVACVTIPITGPRLVNRTGTPLSATIPEPHHAEAASESAIVPADPFEIAVFERVQRTQMAIGRAHAAYLNFSRGLADAFAGEAEVPATMTSPTPARVDVGALLEPSPRPEQAVGGPGVRLDRRGCLEFARGSIANVLGPEFSPVDTFPTRVRLPDEPLMLVDRILEIQGEPRSLTKGRVVTEHDILPGAWYLDGGRIPPSVAIEAGQADLFLSAFLGIDFQTKGQAVYRLLDARVRFHRSLPGPGSTIRYDIGIDRFFRQENTWFFHFHFEATVDGDPLLTMIDGCAGFFTPEELSRGKGIARGALEQKNIAGKRSADWEDLVTPCVGSYSLDQLDALRTGDFGTAFGAEFGKLRLKQPLALPGGRLRLVDRIPHLDLAGGRFGLGLIRGEADIHPDDWFLTCHFVDDPVMPGTLMFECCLHTLRVFLLRLGWIVEADQVRLEPVPGIASQLKCRGQVLGNTRKVTYDVSIKELGFQPAPFVIADAEILVGGVPIVAVSNMSLRYAGVTREMLKETWDGTAPKPRKTAVYEYDRIIASALGKPSKAFGARYEVFDKQRRMACLPAPPFLFLNRITEVQGEPFKLAAGSSAEAQYDIPADAWYFVENRQGDMPLVVLLEVALQPCGWLAAYLGSALTSEQDLFFRNLGGTGNLLASVYPDSGTLTTRVTMTRMSSSAGMLIQWFDYVVRTDAQVVYEGNAYFGFFPESALARQDGLQDASLYQPTSAEKAQGWSQPYPAEPPFAGEQLRMVDAIDLFVPDGGPQKMGFLRASKRVKPEEWFFKAHFHQDPVMPGSLGLEAFLQVLKFIAVRRWGPSAGARWEALALGQSHEWTYRGQILASNQLVTLEMGVTEVNEEKRWIRADGFLSVDGRVIYAVRNFTVRLRVGGRGGRDGIQAV